MSDLEKMQSLIRVLQEQVLQISRENAELRETIRRLKMPMNLFDIDQFLEAMDNGGNGETRQERLLTVMLQYIAHKAVRG